MKKQCAFLVLLSLVMAAAPAWADPWGHHHGRRGPGFYGPQPYYLGPSDYWHRGHWFRGYHGGYDGAWWVVGDSWYLYGAQTETYPDIYTQPVVVVQQGQAPVVYQTAPTATTIVTTTTAAPASTTFAAPAPTAPSGGAVVTFKDSAPAPIEATQSSSTFINKDGRTCREYQTSIMIGGQAKPAHGTACLEADGVWRVVKQ